MDIARSISYRIAFYSRRRNQKKYLRCFWASGRTIKPLKFMQIRLAGGSSCFHAAHGLRATKTSINQIYISLLKQQHLRLWEKLRQKRGGNGFGVLIIWRDLQQQAD